jgi:hypothetical protein
VKKVNKEAMGFDGYITFTTDEVINVDNQSWILVHGYVVKDWCWVPILLIVEHIIDGSNLDNLAKGLLHFC